MNAAAALKILDMTLQVLAVIGEANRIAQITRSAIERARTEGRDLTDDDLAALDEETKAALDGLRAAIDSAKVNRD